MKTIGWFPLLLLLSCLVAWLQPGLCEARTRTEIYQERYELLDPYAKRVNNQGEGFEELYGTRNFRMVLNGVLYRGGANNYYHRTHRRDNRNPLPLDGLENLCAEGFEQATYLYRTNFETAPPLVGCSSRVQPGTRKTLKYSQESPFNNAGLEAIFRSVYEVTQNDQKGPVYIHCWNGWHASGFLSAVALRQFCGWTGEEAVAYWDRNTDGHNQDPSFERIRQDIRDFVPKSQWSIDASKQAEICP